jgi:hypothetical protein
MSNEDPGEGPSRSNEDPGEGPSRSNENPGEGPSGTSRDSANFLDAFDIRDWVHDEGGDPSEELDLSKYFGEFGPAIGNFRSSNSGSGDNGGSVDNPDPFDLGDWGCSSDILDNLLKDSIGPPDPFGIPGFDMVAASRLRDVEHNLRETVSLLKESERLRLQTERCLHLALSAETPELIMRARESGIGRFCFRSPPVWVGAVFSGRHMCDYLVPEDLLPDLPRPRNQRTPDAPSVSSITVRSVAVSPNPELDVPRAADSLLRKLGESGAAEGWAASPNGDEAASPNRYETASPNRYQTASPNLYETPPPNRHGTPPNRDATPSAARDETAPPDRDEPSDPDREGTPSSNGDENGDETYAPTPPPTKKRPHQLFNVPQSFGSNKAGLVAGRTPGKPSKSQQQPLGSGPNPVQGVEPPARNPPSRIFGGKPPRSPPHRPFGGKSSPRHPPSNENSSKPNKKRKDPENSDDSEDSEELENEAQSRERAKKAGPHNSSHGTLGGNSLPQYLPSNGSPSKLNKKRKDPEDSGNATQNRKRIKREDPDAIYDSETKEKLKKGQWRRSKLRAVYEILKEEDGNSGTSASLWNRVTKRYCARFPGDYKDNPEKAEGAMKNAWNRYGRVLFNYDERKRKINPSLSTSSQANRKKQGKNRQQDVTTADAITADASTSVRQLLAQQPPTQQTLTDLHSPPLPSPAQGPFIAQQRFDPQQPLPNQQPYLTQVPLPAQQRFYPQPPHLNQGPLTTQQPLTPLQLSHPRQPLPPQRHMHRQNLPTHTYGSLDEQVLSTIEGQGPFTFNPFNAPLRRQPRLFQTEDGYLEEDVGAYGEFDYDENGEDDDEDEEEE